MKDSQRKAMFSKKAVFENYAVYKTDKNGDGKFHLMSSMHKSKVDANNWADMLVKGDFIKEKIKIVSRPLIINQFSKPKEEFDFLIDKGWKLK